MSGPNAALKEVPKGGEGYDANHPNAAHIQVVDAAQGILRPTQGEWRKHIAICGFASSTRAYILDRCARPDWEIWGLNQLYRHIPRADRWFDIHHNWNEETVEGTDYRSWIRDCGIPFYMLKRQPDLPTTVEYPIGLVLGLGADYFTSTIAYMTALAIWEIDRHVSRAVNVALRRGDLSQSFDVMKFMRDTYAEHTIGIFGVDLTVGGEYFDEKPCAEFWIGQGVARGIRMEIPPESALCKQTGRYGYDKAATSLINAKEVGEHQSTLRAERDELLKRLYMLEGAMECDERWKQVLELRSRGTMV